MREDNMQILLVRYIYYPYIARQCQVFNAYLNDQELMVDKLREGPMTEIREKEAYCLIIIIYGYHYVSRMSILKMIKLSEILNNKCYRNHKLSFSVTHFHNFPVIQFDGENNSDVTRIHMGG